MRFESRLSVGPMGVLLTLTFALTPRISMWSLRLQDLQQLCAFYKVLGTYPVQ